MGLCLKRLANLFDRCSKPLNDFVDYLLYSLSLSLNSSQNHPETASLIPLKDNLIFKLPLDKSF
jgi:hypothetical protein